MAWSDKDRGSRHGSASIVELSLRLGDEMALLPERESAAEPLQAVCQTALNLMPAMAATASE